MVIGILITIAVALGNRSDDTESTNPSCKTDWTKCIDNAEIANKYSRWFNAQFRCKQEAIKQARYGTLEFPSLYFFSTFYKGNSYITSGTAILIEPDAQFQNGFGAMAHSQVICTYDLRGERVVSVDILLK